MDVILSSDVAAESFSERFNTGDLVTIGLYLECSGASAVFGGELELCPATGDLNIRSVAFNSAFSAALGAGAHSANDPAVGATRVQPLGAINRNLGADGAPVHFATVELEVLSEGPFESALIVKARGALVGKLPESTVVLGNPSGEDGWGVGRIEIVNTAEREQGTGNGEQAAAPGTVDQGTGEQVSDWDVEQGVATLEVRPVGGGEAVTVLAPNTEYEIHYTAGGSVNGFDLIVTSESAGGPPLGVEGSETESGDGPPTSVGGSESAAPAFDACWEGATVMDLPSDGAGLREVVSADLPSEFQVSGFEFRVPLCNFTTGAAGTLALDLWLYETDSETRTLVEMPATAELTIE